jgi:hypothetical protein
MVVVLYLYQAHLQYSVHTLLNEVLILLTLAQLYKHTMQILPNTMILLLTFTGTLQNGGSNVVVDTDIGSTVQGYDADTAKYDDATANFTGNLQKSGANVLTGNQTITLSQVM